MKALYGLFCGEGKPWKHKAFFASVDRRNPKKKKSNIEREQCLERQFTRTQRLNVEMKAFCGIFCGEGKPWKC